MAEAFDERTLRNTGILESFFSAKSREIASSVQVDIKTAYSEVSLNIAAKQIQPSVFSGYDVIHTLDGQNIPLYKTPKIQMC